jgi:hypothetical protein
MEPMTEETGQRLAMAHEVLAQVIKEQPAPPAPDPEPTTHNAMHVVGMTAGAGLAAAHIILWLASLVHLPMDPGVAADLVTLIALGGGYLVHRNSMRTT